MSLFKRKSDDRDSSPSSPFQGDATASDETGAVRIEVAPPADDAEIAKLTLDRQVSPGGSVYFTSKADADGWPMVERLFEVPNLHSVLAKDNVVVISKTDDATWPPLLDAAKRVIAAYYAGNPDADAKVAEVEVDEAEIRRRVTDVLDTDINPSVASHGGVVRLLDVQGSRVFLQMGGGCQGCGMASVTLREGVEKAIRAKVPEVTEILDTTDHAAGTNPYYAN